MNYDLFNITINTWNIAKKRVSHDLLSKPGTPPDDEQVFTDDERRKVWDMVYDDLEHHSRQASTAGLQILFLLETGLRIGECCGLKWPDVRNGRLYIRRQADNDGVREWTKSSCSRRDIPLTSRALKILDDVREFNDAHGYSAEWIFQSGNPKYDYRLSYGAAAHKLRRLCDKLGTPRKSPHKLRKTCISTLLDDPDVNNRTVQRFAGHSDIRTTEAFYNFERRSRAEQAAAIDRALSL